jgi:hypothetical protein
MTVAVNHRQVVIPVVAVISIEVMDLNQRFRCEDESTGFTSSTLIFE